jgi:hypothetical protein
MALNILSEWYLAENQRFGILEFFNRIGRNRLFVLLKFTRILWQLTGFKQSLDSGVGV